MKLINNIRGGLLSLTVLLTAFCLTTLPARAMSVSPVRDNDDNAVIRGGCLTVNECQQKVQNDRVAANILSCFGAGDADMRNLDKTAVVGEVRSDNTVRIPDQNGNMRVVATNAITGGRQNMPGSTRSSCGNFPFFERPPSVSFASSSLTAFVVMDSNDQFDFAILTACGNGVKATPVKKTAKPVATPTKPATPTQTQQQQQQQTVVINNTQPVQTQQQQSPPSAPAQTQTQTVSPAPAKSLPNTGAGSVAGLTLLTTGVATLGHLLYQRFWRRV